MQDFRESGRNPRPHHTCLLGPASFGQASAKLTFEVASVRQNKSADESTVNVPLTRGDFYPANGGVFSGRAMPLANYIDFAYKVTDFQKQTLLAHAPGWIASDHFNIEARAAGTPTKDQMRLMMKSLLADRFKLAIHEETRQVPVFAMVLDKPGVTGPGSAAAPQRRSSLRHAPQLLRRLWHRAAERAWPPPHRRPRCTHTDVCRRALRIGKPRPAGAKRNRPERQL